MDPDGGDYLLTPLTSQNPGSTVHERFSTLTRSY